MSQPTTPTFDVPLSQLLTEDQIVECMTCATAKQAVEALVDRLADRGLVEKKTVAVKRVMERERLASTALGHGIAIPHARMDVGNKPVFAIGRHSDGIDFDAPDGKPVNLIFLMLWQPERPGLFNQLFANLVAKLNNSSFRQGLLDAEGAGEIRTMLEGVRIDWMHTVETSLDGSMLMALQELESVKPKNDKDAQKVARQVSIIRQDLDASILWRYDRLRKLHGVAVVKASGGVCSGCSMQLSSGLASEILKNPNSLFICERCGRFLKGAE